jgi:ABC-type Mn2+/Zn2+ transport system permease subunit
VNGLWHWLADPWSQAIVQRAFLEVTLIGLAGGLLGCWIVLYGLSYGAESLSHGLFPGLVVAALLGAPLILGAAAGLLVGALAVALAGRLTAIGRDTAVAVVVTSAFGLGVLLALSPASPPGIQGLLFGDILASSDSDLLLAAILVAVVAVALRLLHWRLLTVGFDRAGVRALGLSALRADIALLILMAAGILVAVQGLGSLLVVAVLVAPAATARLLARRMVTMMCLSCGLAILAGLGGLYLSYHASLAAGACVAAMLVGVYLVAALAVSVRVHRPPRPEPEAAEGAAVPWLA